MAPTTVTNSIRRLRFERGEMTQQDLAEKVGVTRQTVNAIEAGKYSPSLEAAFRISQDQLGTLQDVIAVLELRIAVETESAALAAMRRSAENLQALRDALKSLASALEEGRDAVGADYQFHLEIARATQNQHFVELMGTLGGMMIPRARLEPPGPMTPERQAYLRRVNAEHESIVDAISRQDPEAARAAMRTHLANSRERRRRLAEGT